MLILLLLLLHLTTNHIYIGAVYIMSGLIGGSIGFGLSIILRLELALPGFILCSSLQYNPNITFTVFYIELIGIWTTIFTLGIIILGSVSGIVLISSFIWLVKNRLMPHYNHYLSFIN